MMVGRSTIFAGLLVGTALATTAFGQTASVSATASGRAAQESAVKDDVSSGDILVTGSRIDRAGFEAPTPVRVFGAGELQVGNRSNVIAALNDQPQFVASVSATTTSQNTNIGAIRPDLRGLGAIRTLTLLDGRRTTADQDLNLIPSSLVKRVDVVTGGASAAWGAGAVAGVVNIALDRDLRGLKLSAGTGVSARDGNERRLSGAYGTRFAGGRGYVLLGADYVNTQAGSPRDDLNAIHLYDVISNPNYTKTNGQSLYLLAPVRYADRSVGGLITSGPLAGQTFNPDGTLRPFQYGIVRGSLMIGGEGPWENDGIPMTPPLKRWSAMGRIGYDLTNTTTMTIDVLHGDNRSVSSHYLPESQTFTISVNNAFLPTAVATQLRTAGVSSFTLGRYDTDFAFVGANDRRTSTEITAAIKGKLGNRFRWDAYYSHGTLDVDLYTNNRTLRTNLLNAVDSVISPVTGQPICRIALTNPTTDCVPINLFGQGAPSAAASAYVTGTNESHSDTELQVAAATIRGEPFNTWAGPVSLAVGGEWRRSTLDITVGANDAALAFRVQNYAPLSGKVSVKEGFGEVLIPLARDVPLLRSLNLNAAVRASDYSTSGWITSWKVGLTDELVPGLRLRGSISRDIRAPALNELFLQRTTTLATVVVDPTINQSVPITIVRGGNPALNPERSMTKTAGMIVTPTAIPGFSISADYFDIDIKGVITTLAAQTLLNNCAGGDSGACTAIERDSSGNLVRVFATLNNLTHWKTSGVDIDFSYRRRIDVLHGDIYNRIAVTWLRELNIAGQDYRGSVFQAGPPEWRGTATIGYDGIVFGTYARLRYVGEGVYNRSIDIQNNHVAPRAYLDLGMSAKVKTGGTAFELSLAVTNATNRNPPNGSWYSPLYDLLGRYYTAGVKLRF